MQIRKRISRLLALLTVISVTLAFMPVISGSAYALDNSTNYERKSGPFVDDAYVNLIADTPDKSIEIYNQGNVYNETLEDISYDEKTNTLTLRDFRHPEFELAAHTMGDDFTVRIYGDCELGKISVLGKSYTDYITGEPFEPYYYGGSLNITGSGTLTVNEARSENCGIELWGWGCESLIDISRHVSLRVYGKKDTGDPEIQATAVFISGSSGFYDKDAITINEDGVKKPLHSVHAKYNVEGFQFEGDPATLKDYWLDNSDFVIDGDGVTIIDDAEVVLEDEYIEYTGKAIAPLIKTIDGFALTEGEDYTVTYSPSPAVDAGDYKVNITGKGKFRGRTSASFTIFPDSGKTKAKAVGKTITLKYKNLKKKSQTVKKAKYVTVASGQGTVSYKLISAKKGKKSFKKYFSISKSTGKITVKKKLKKGTYTLRVRATAKGSSNYKVTGYKTITVKIRVK